MIIPKPDVVGDGEKGGTTPVTRHKLNKMIEMLAAWVRILGDLWLLGLSFK